MSPRCPCARVARAADAPRLPEPARAPRRVRTRRPGSSAGWRLAMRGSRSALGATWANPAPARFALPGITTPRPAARPSTAARATSPAGIHMNLGSVSAASSSVMPAASAKPVSTGPGHSVVTVTPVPRSSARERAPVGQHEGLRGAVAGLSGQRLEGGGRRGVQHRAAMPGDHAGHEQGAQIDDRFDVGAHQRELGGAVGPVHGAHRREARVVDEDVGVQSARFQLCRERATRVGIGEVGGNDLGADGVRVRQLVGQCLQAVGAPGHQGQAMAASRQLPCDLRPDARRCTGDDRGRVLLGCRQCHDEIVGDRLGPTLGVVGVRSDHGDVKFA